MLITRTIKYTKQPSELPENGNYSVHSLIAGVTINGSIVIIPNNVVFHLVKAIADSALLKAFVHYVVGNLLARVDDFRIRPVGARS